MAKKQSMTPIAGYEGLYSINEKGEIFSYPKPNRRVGGLLNHCKDGKGYHYVVLFKSPRNGKMHKVHRLVALQYIPNEQDKPQVNHIDGDKGNNNSSNLEWCTNKENAIHAISIGLKKDIGENHRNAKLTSKIVASCRLRNKDGELIKNLADEFGVAHQVMSCAINHKTWKHL